MIESKKKRFIGDEVIFDGTKYNLSDKTIGRIVGSDAIDGITNYTIKAFKEFGGSYTICGITEELIDSTYSNKSNASINAVDHLILSEGFKENNKGIDISKI